MNLGLSSSRLLVAITLAAALLTALVLVFPVGTLAGHSRDLHVAIETAASVVALVAGGLLLNRFRESQALADLLLVIAFAVLVLANLCFSWIPALLGYSHTSFAIWSSVAGRLLGAGVFAAAALSPTRHVASRQRLAVFAAVACVVLLAAITGIVSLVADHLPAGVLPQASDAEANSPKLAADHVLLATQFLSAVVLAAAGVGFERRALRSGDQLMHWIAAACILRAFAFLNYFVFPSLYSDWVSMGDVLRGSAYFCLLLGGFGELGVYRRRATHAARVEERDAIARDLHDVLAQDLAFLAGRLRDLEAKAELGHGGDTGLLAMLSSAAQRALDESRVTVWSLVKPDTPIEAAVEHTAEEVAAREGGSVLVEAKPGVKASQAQKHALLCIVREAVTNAIRHGQPRRVEVRLKDDDDDGILLEVGDNGKGFEGQPPHGFGLTTIQQRVTAFGGKANITSRPGEGTIVRVRLPAEAMGDGMARNALAAQSHPRRTKLQPVQSLNVKRPS